MTTSLLRLMSRARVEVRAVARAAARVAVKAAVEAAVRAAVRVAAAVIATVTAARAAVEVEAAVTATVTAARAAVEVTAQREAPMLRLVTKLTQKMRKSLHRSMERVIAILSLTPKVKISQSSIVRAEVNSGKTILPRLTWMPLTKRCSMKLPNSLHRLATMIEQPFRA